MKCLQMRMEKRRERDDWASHAEHIVKNPILLRLVRRCPQLHPASQLETDSKPALRHNLAVSHLSFGTHAMATHVFRQRSFFQPWFILEINFYAHRFCDMPFASAV
jgi:hypothetical protein